MMTRIAIFLLAIICGPALAEAQDALLEAAGRYRITEAGSTIAFSVANLAGGAIAGKFRSFSGEITIDAADIGRSTVSISLVPSSVDAGEARTTAFLKSNAVFDAAQEDAITFQATRVTQIAPTAARIDGRLTARGRTGTESFEAHLLRRDRNSISFGVTGQVLRSRYGMDVGTPIYTNVVDFDMVLTADRL